VSSPTQPYDPEYWRKRVEETRELVEKLGDADKKLLMLAIAEIYEQIEEIPKKRRLGREAAPSG
jgi:hypothetical protein